MKPLLSICSVAILLASLSGCSSIRVWNNKQSPLNNLYVIKATMTDDGWNCGIGANILSSPLQPGESYTESGLLPGRYCVNSRYVDVPLIGQVDIYID